MPRAKPVFDNRSSRRTRRSKTPVGDQPICSDRALRLIDPVWLFENSPKGFWAEPKNRRNFLLWLGHKLRFRRMRDWYRLSYQDMACHRGSGLANAFWHGSPIHAVKECFPNYDWQEWFFAQAPRTFWHSSTNRRRYMTWLGEQLGFQKTEDWYKATTVDFQRHRGGALLLEYRSSVSETVAACFPRRDWKPWLFERAPNCFWQDRENCRTYLLWLGKRLGYKHPDDWYRLKGDDFKNNHGRMLLRRYRSSVAEVVMDLLPRRNWCEWKFTRVPPGFWNHIENRRRYILWLGKHFRCRRAKDWLRVRCKDFYDHCGGSLVIRYHSHWDLLEECIPEWDWEPCRA